MKIAFVVTRSDSVGGAQVHVRDLSIALAARGHHPVVLVGGEGPWLDQLAAANIEVVKLQNMGRAVNPLRDLPAYFELRRQLKAVAPDIVSTHNAKGGWLGRIAARTLKLPVVFTAHGWTFTDGIGSLKATIWRWAERAVGWMADRTITVSEYDRQLALNAHIARPERVLTVHNGMPDVADTLRANPAANPPGLVMVARFEDQKDHATLLKALARSKDLEWKLDLIGGGPLEQSLRDLCTELGLDERVSFLGPRSDIAQRLAAAQIFILSTHWEGLPRSIIEAMRAGLPVVASSVAGIPELIDDGVSGLLSKPRDVEDLGAKLRRLLSSPEERRQMGQQGRLRYEAGFRFERMLDETVKTYFEVLSERAPADSAERDAVISASRK